MIIASSHDDANIPATALTPYVLERAAELGEKPALIDGPSGRTITYQQLGEMIHKAAAGLRQRGFGKGDVFAIYSRNMRWLFTPSLFWAASIPPSTRCTQWRN